MAIGRQVFSSREVIFGGFFNPWNEEIPILETRPIRKSYILTFVPNTESSSCTSPITVTIKVFPTITRIIWTISIATVKSVSPCCSTISGLSNHPIVTSPPYSTWAWRKHWCVMSLAIDSVTFLSIISIYMALLSIGVIFCRVSHTYFATTRSWNIFEFENNNKIKQYLT